ncbi:MAG: hypothetical protein QXY49_06545 [Thermofilaceae archaeon]
MTSVRELIYEVYQTVRPKYLMRELIGALRSIGFEEFPDKLVK